MTLWYTCSSRSFTRQLPTDTLNLLHEFYRERDDRAKQFEDLKTKAEDDYDSKQLSMELFTEDWNASQFWVRASPCWKSGGRLSNLS